MKSLPFLLASMALAAPVVADVTHDVRCREIGFSEAAEARDAESFSSFIDPDARFVGSLVTTGPDAITEAWGPFFAEDGPTIRWRPQFVEVLEEGQLALTRGPYRMVATDPEGKEMEQWGTFNSVWRLHDSGEWKVVFDAGSPAAAAPPEEIQAFLYQEDSCGD